MPSIWQLFVSIGADNSDFKRGMRESETIAEKFGNTFSSLDKKLGAALGFGAIGAGAIAAANKFETASVSIQRATGATGDKLESLEKSFTAVYTQTAKSADQVSSALALLSTRTGATGANLEKLTLSALRLSSVHKEDIATIIPAVTQMFSAWGIETNKQAAALDYLRVVSQQTGTPVARLTEEVVSQAPMLKLLGYNWEQATALIGNFDKSGALAQGGLNALKKVLATFAKEGVKDTAAEWAKLVKGVENGTVTLDKFLKLAGARGGVPLFDAIKNHRADVNDLAKSYDDLAKQGTATTKTLHEKFTIWQHDMEAMISAHKDLIVTVGLVGPSVIGLAGMFKNLAASAIPAIGNIAFALSNGLVGALGAVEAALLASGILALIAGVGIAGYKLGDAMQQKFAPGGNTEAFNPNSRWQSVPSATGHGYDIVPRGPKAGIGGSILDYISGLPGGSAPKPAPAGTPLGDDAISKDFSTLHLKDLQAELSAATKAFNELTAAGKLNAGQIKEATEYIDGLREKLALLRAGLKEPPKSTADLLKAIGVPAPTDMEPVKEAFGELLQRYSAFVGPKSSDGVNTMVDAWIAYGRAISAAKAEEEARKVPFYDAIDAQNRENAALQETIDSLNGLPEKQRDVSATMTAAMGAVLGLTDAYHAFNLQTPWELQQAVDAERRQYEILRDSGTASAYALDKAFVTYKLHQIELDHQLGVTDDALYAQQKKNAEDALNEIDGKTHESAQRRTKYERSIAEDMKSNMEGAFSSLHRGLARNLIEWKGWSDTIKNFGKTVAEDVLSSFMKGLFKPMEDGLTKLGEKLGKVFDGIWGSSGSAGSAAGSAGGAAGGLGGAGSAGGAAASGVMGTIGAVGAAVGAVSSVIGNFQMAGMNKSLDVLVNHTLRIFNEVYNFRADAWTREQHWYVRTADMWQTLLDIKDTLGRGITANGKGGISFNNCTFNGTTPQSMMQAAFNEAVLAGAL